MMSVYMPTDLRAAFLKVNNDAGFGPAAQKSWAPGLATREIVGGFARLQLWCGTMMIRTRRSLGVGGRLDQSGATLREPGRRYDEDGDIV